MFKIEGETLVWSIDTYKQVWTISRLFEYPNPLNGASFTERGVMLHQMIQHIENKFAGLSKMVQTQILFSKYFQTENVTTLRITYPLISGTKDSWEIIINKTGITYIDQAGIFGTPGIEREQLISDYWFFGPLMPVPDIHIRKTILDEIKNNLSGSEIDISTTHFELFEYPTRSTPQMQWTTGNYDRQDVFSICPYGISISSTNYRELGEMLSFVSFEYCLQSPLDWDYFISEDIRKAIEYYVNRISKYRTNKLELEANMRIPTPRQKMDTAELMLKEKRSIEGAKMLLSLLDFQSETDYWIAYVFNTCLGLRENTRVQKFIIECLEGENSLYFKKAVDVLFIWGERGDVFFQDVQLIKRLNWEAAKGDDAGFSKVVEQVKKELGI